MAERREEPYRSAAHAAPYQDLSFPAEVKAIEKNTFIDFPLTPMADLPPPTASAPLFMRSFTSQPGAAPPGLASPGVEKALVCAHCGNTFLPDANFCRKCGKPRPQRCGDDYSDGKLRVQSVEHDVDLDGSSSTDCPPDSPPPENAEGELLGLPSVGSAAHAGGACTPCAWFWKVAGCRHGASCSRCHLCPEGTLKARRKTKEAMLRAQARQQPEQQQQRQRQRQQNCMPMNREPAYVEHGQQSSPSPTSIPREPFLPVSEAPPLTAAGEHKTEMDPMKVVVKNTFIHFDVPSTPKPNASPPTNSFPGALLHRLLERRRPAGSAPAFPQSQPDTTTDSAVQVPPRPLEAPPSNEIAVSDVARDIGGASVGAQAHARGECTPCAYFWYKKDGCRQGRDCNFCHLCEKGEVKRRKKNRIQQLKAAGEFIPGFAQLQEAAKATETGRTHAENTAA